MLATFTAFLLSILSRFILPVFTLAFAKIEGAVFGWLGISELKMIGSYAVGLFVLIASSMAYASSSFAHGVIATFGLWFLLLAFMVYRQIFTGTKQAVMLVSEPIEPIRE